MEGSKEGTDASSIKPVSSLRSRFENLDKNTAAPASPTTGRSRFLSTNNTGSDGRPSTSHGEKDASNGPTEPGTPIELAFNSKRFTSPKQRPQSMISVTPSRNAPPLLTVDSPNSPDKSFNASTERRNFSADSQPRQSKSGAPSPSPSWGRRPSYGAIPALNSHSPSPHPDVQPRKPSLETASGAGGLPRSPTGGAPPPVNRAGKPQIPTKPAALTKKPEGLAAPEPTGGDASDRSASPFNTPPSSGTSSPAPGDRKPSLQNQSHTALNSVTQRSRGDSDLSLNQHARTRSDASFVERLRSDSNASPPKTDSRPVNIAGAERRRADSEIAAAKPSSPSFPDRGFAPAQIPPSREPHIKGLTRTGTLPARPSPRSTLDNNSASGSSEDRPRLPLRPELQMRPGRVSPHKAASGRTSPTTRSLQIPSRPKSMEVLDPGTVLRTDSSTPSRIPATKPAQRSALAQGFATPSSPSQVPSNPPAIPAPRRSADRRREAPPPPTANQNGHSRDDVEDIPPLESSGAPAVGPADYPDASQTSRRPPKYRQRPWHISTDYDTRVFAACGEFVCTGGYQTKVWNTRTGERLFGLEHNESKVTSIVFKPVPSGEDDGSSIWLGTSLGEIHEVHVPSQAVVKTKPNAHTRREIIRMWRYASEIWSLDESGELSVWKAGQNGVPSLDAQCEKFRTPRGHTFSSAVGGHLWIATGKEIRVFAPSARSDMEFQVLREPLSQPGTGEIYSGATLSGKPDLVYFGHQDGKVTIYNRHDFSCVGVVNVSVYKLSSLAGVGDYLWAGFNTGMAYVYDVSSTPWRVLKDWQAHEKQICGISSDRSAFWKFGRLQVVTLGTDNMLRIWDGMLEEDWLETRMMQRDSEYCSFQEITAAVMTWNAGAVKPTYLQQSREDAAFFRDYMSDRETPPDIFVFGFQELVDLENKKVTAKSFFKSKKKDSSETEHMSHQYRAWRDYLTRCLEENMPSKQSYTLLHTASLVGLFTCVFVKTDLRKRIRHVQSTEVKRGMGGLHGNKGALVFRMLIDDSSLCFINCHLAAGQTQTLHRNNDIAGILEAEALPACPLNQSDSTAQHSDVFTSGGDGSMILDHEICILNGDLNYRIDTMGRDTVVKHVRDRNLVRLLERDQLLLSRKKNPGFRLRAFQESPITFAPTYKYNLGSDEYDTSEKRRAPAWCDRILYRGLGKVRMEEYRRWEVRVSDHRPVSGWLRIRVKTVDDKRRGRVWEAVDEEFEDVRRKVGAGVQLEYFTHVLGLSRAQAQKALQAVQA